MAIFGPAQAILNQTHTDPRFQAALGYLRGLLPASSAARARLGSIASGVTERIELSGGSFALEQVYVPKARAAGFFESHRKYIDVQIIVEGEELMEVEDISRLTVTEAYSPERDFIKYGDTTTASVLKMRAGDVAVFFPEDGHMPSLHWRGTGLLRKSVVKVPVG
jgi:YhcH/YjgK/YiaL family protein